MFPSHDLGGGFEGEHFGNYNDFNTKDTGREYLANTYGKCESQLHTASSGTEMPEVKPIKPIYTKEMHERGLLPKVGMECLIAYKGGNTFKGKIKYISKDGFVYERENGTDSFNGSIDIVKFKPIPTIEDDLVDIFEKAACKTDYSIERGIHAIVEKYNITPKGE